MNIDDIKNIVRDIFNIDCKVIDNQHLDSTVSVKIHSVVIKKLFNDIIGNNSKDKSDYLNFIQSGSKDCLKQFIVGYFRTDGCAFHSGYTLSSTNKNLINILNCKYLDEKYRLNIKYSLILGMRYFISAFFDMSSGKGISAIGLKRPAGPVQYSEAIFAFCDYLTLDEVLDLDIQNQIFVFHSPAYDTCIIQS